MIRENYLGGIDASMEENLSSGYICAFKSVEDSDILFVHSFYDYDSEDYKMDWSRNTQDDILDVLEDMDSSFYDYVGFKKDNYISDAKIAINDKDISMLCGFIGDIQLSLIHI